MSYWEIVAGVFSSMGLIAGKSRIANKLISRKNRAVTKKVERKLNSMAMAEPSMGATVRPAASIELSRP
jgi:hypothetical protein